MSEFKEYLRQAVFQASADIKEGCPPRPVLSRQQRVIGEFLTELCASEAPDWDELVWVLALPADVLGVFDLRPTQIVGHPCLPEQLFDLCAQIYPRELLSNPHFRLCLLTDAGVVDRLGLDARVAIAGCEVIAPGLLNAIAGSPRQHRRVREAAAGNPVCPVALMADFATQAVSVRTRLSKNPALPASVGQQLAQVERARLQAGWDVRTSDATGARAVHGRSGRGLRTRQHIWRRR